MSDEVLAYMSENDSSDDIECNMLCESRELDGSGAVGSKVIDSMFSDVQMYEVSDGAGIQIACSYCNVKEAYRGLLGGATIDRIVFDFDNGTATVYKRSEHSKCGFEPVMEFDLLIALVPKTED